MYALHQPASGSALPLMRRPRARARDGGHGSRRCQIPTRAPGSSHLAPGRRTCSSDPALRGSCLHGSTELAHYLCVPLARMVLQRGTDVHVLDVRRSWYCREGRMSLDVRRLYARAPASRARARYSEQYSQVAPAAAGAFGCSTGRGLRRSDIGSLSDTTGMRNRELLYLNLLRRGGGLGGVY